MSADIQKLRDQETLDLRARIAELETELSRRPAVVSEGQAVAWTVVENGKLLFTSGRKDIAEGWLRYSSARTLEPLAFCRPAAPAPEAPPEPVKRTLGQQVADAQAIVAADPGRFKHVILQGDDSLATPATEQAPTKDSGDA